MNAKQIRAHVLYPCDTSRGAPMGRRPYTLDADGQSIHFLDDGNFCLLSFKSAPRLFSIQRITLDSGGYDEGGAYWGLCSNGMRFYFAFSRDDAGEVLRFERAKSRAHMLASLRKEFPRAYTRDMPREFRRVVFRVWRKGGNVIALFPDDLWNEYGDVASCESVGQHGAADYQHVIRATRPATPDEYAALKRELEAAPYHYDLRVVSRACPRR